MGESAEKIVNTNMGAMPLEDYLDIVALQHGFDSCEEMKTAGYWINTDNL